MADPEKRSRVTVNWQDQLADIQGLENVAGPSLLDRKIDRAQGTKEQQDVFDKVRINLAPYEAYIRATAGHFTLGQAMLDGVRLVGNTASFDLVQNGEVVTASMSYPFKDRERRRYKSLEIGENRITFDQSGKIVLISIDPKSMWSDDAKVIRELLRELGRWVPTRGSIRVGVGSPGNIGIALESKDEWYNRIIPEKDKFLLRPDGALPKSTVPFATIAETAAHIVLPLPK